MLHLERQIGPGGEVRWLVGDLVTLDEREWMQLVMDYNRQCGDPRDWLVRQGMEYSEFAGARFARSEADDAE